MRVVLNQVREGCRFAAALLLVMTGLAAAARASDGSPRAARIVDARIGLRDHYKLGCWTPVRVEIDAGTEAAGLKSLRVDVTAADSDGVPTTASAAAGAAGGAGPVVVYTQVGRVDSPIRISLRNGEQLLDERTLSPKHSVAKNTIVPIAATSELIVSLGTAAYGLRDAFPDRPASGSQVGRKVVELAEIADLPTSWYGYDGVDVLLLPAGDGRLCERLATDKRRMTALERWIELGGRLVVLCDGQNAPAMLAAGRPLAALAPGGMAQVVRLPDKGTIEHYAAAADAPGVAIAADVPIFVPRLTDVRGTIEAYSTHGRRPTDLPLIVRTARGFGEIAFAGFELSRPPFSTWSGRTLFLRALLRPYLPEAVSGEASQKLATTGIHDLSGALRQRLGRHFSRVTTLGFPLVAGIAIGYLLVLGPLDYVFTQRWLRRSLLAWATFPLIILAFAALALAVGRWSRGAAHAELNRLELVDFDTIGGHVRGTFWGALYSPAARLFDLEVKPARAAAGSPGDVEILFSWWGLPGVGIGGMQTTGSDLGIIRTGYRYGSARDRLERVPVLVSATKSVVARWNTTASEQLDAQLADEEGLATGSVTNHTGVALKNARLLYGGWAYRLGNLEVGERKEIGPQLSPRSTKTIVTSDALGERAAATGAAEARIFSAEQASAMEIARLMMFYDAAGGIDFAHLPNRYQSYCDLSRQLVLGRAILVAEAATDGTTLAGAAGQTAGDDEADTALVIYRFLLPVAPAKTP